MKKKSIRDCIPEKDQVRKIWKIMRITFILLTVSLMHVSASLYSQKTRLALDFENETLQNVFRKIQDQSEFDFFYKNDQIPADVRITARMNNKTVEEVLDEVLAGTGLTYKVIDRDIVIKMQESEGEQDPQQQTSVSGIVSDESGQPLPGVAVLVKGTTQGTVTHADGKYSLTNIPENAVLVFSFVGMKTREVLVSGNNTINIVLEDEILGIEDVVVIGYGTLLKRDVTGAVTVIKNKEILALPTTNALRSLQGKVAGLDVTVANGDPGAQINLLLRGNRSLRASNAPMVLIDGIDYGTNLDINPADIESVEVLKDISSTAIYGTRGANGIIYVTTKKGKFETKSNITYNAYLAVNNIGRYPKSMNGPEFVQLKREAYRATNNNVYRNDNEIFNATELEYIKNNQYVDWFDGLFQTGFIQNHNVGINGGNDKTAYAMSLGFQDNNGLYKNQDYKRFNGKISVDQSISKVFKVGMSAIYNYTNKNGRDNPYPLTRIYRTLPLAKKYNEDGSLVYLPAASGAQITPYADEEPGYYIQNTISKRLFASGYLDAHISKELLFKTTIGIDLNDSRAGNFRAKYSYAGTGTKPTSSATLGYSYRYTWENILNFNTSFDKSVIYALIGTTTIASSNESFTARGANQPSNTTTFYDLGANADSKDVASNLSQNQLVSTFARANYIYNGRYTIQASIRFDGSSVLAKGHKWGYFPSVSGAWNIINEDFMKNLPIFNNLKLRASWGKAGNSSISPYGTLGGLSKSVYSFGGTGAYGYYPSSIPNPDLTWETTASWNIGIDFSILKNRISGTVDNYLTRTSNLLLPALLPTSTGYNSVMQNVGKTENKGVELTLTTENIKTRDFNWTTDFTFTLNREKIVSLNAGIKENVANLWFVGQPVRVFYDYKKIGIWQLGEEEAAKAFGSFKPGDVKVEDKNQNGVFDSGDRQVFSKVPDFIAGLNTVFNYRNFDLSAFFYARAGQTIEYDYYYYYVRGAQENSTKVDYWTPENPTNAFPQPNSTQGQTGGLFQHTWSFTDGSFLKIREITFGYTLPESWMTKINIRKIRVYGTLTNYFKWGKLTDYDSENNGDIVSPLPKQAVFGIDVSF